MTRSPIGTKLLAVLLMAVAVGIVAWGSMIVSFASTRSSSAAAEEGEPSAAIPPEAIGPMVHERTPGLRAEIIRDRIERAAASGAGVASLRDTVEDLLAHHPTEPNYWPYLAELDAYLDPAGTEIRAALQMSWLTERREGSAMVRRSLLGVQTWNDLPDDMRSMVIGDITSLAPHLSRNRAEALKAVLTDQPDEVRSDIRRQLAERGGDQRLAQRLGL